MQKLLLSIIQTIVFVVIGIGMIVGKGGRKD